MVKRLIALLGTLVAAAVVAGMVGLLVPNMVDAQQQPSAIRSFSSRLGGSGWRGGSDGDGGERMGSRP